MKNKLESFAVILVGLLSLLIIYFIVQYNLIDDGDMVDNSTYEIPVEKKVSKKEKTNSYLKNLEGYTDVDVDVDPTQENTVNRVEVKSELGDDAMDAAVDDKEKKSYTQNLENYSNKKSGDTEPEEQEEHEPQKLEHEEIVDEIGLAIGAALEDL